MAQLRLLAVMLTITLCPLAFAAWKIDPTKTVNAGQFDAQKHLTFEQLSDARSHKYTKTLDIDVHKWILTEEPKPNRGKFTRRRHIYTFALDRTFISYIEEIFEAADAADINTASAIGTKAKSSIPPLDLSALNNENKDDIAITPADTNIKKHQNIFEKYWKQSAFVAGIIYAVYKIRSMRATRRSEREARERTQVQ